MSAGLHWWSLVLSETILRADLHQVLEKWKKLFYSGGEGSVTRAVSLTDILETSGTLWLQHLGALAPQHWWGPCKYIIGRWVHCMQSMLGWSCLLYSKEYYTSYLDHFYRRNHFFPWAFPGSREKGEELSAWVRILNGFGWILFQVFISPQGEWNRSYFNFWFWNWTSFPSP